MKGMYDTIKCEMKDINIEDQDDRSVTLPRVMIAAAASGSGKTTITCGLLHLLKDRGLDPVSFKCGPDYIDPMFHRTVLGIDSLNLDTFLAGADGVRKTIAQLSEAHTDGQIHADEAKTTVHGSGARYAVIEGVMGVYDGISPDSLEGSSYEIAQITKTPIILVVNAQGTGRTVISLIKGILLDDHDCLIKGIILNNMSDPYYEKTRDTICHEISAIREDVRVLGHIPKTDAIDLESRHLGLKMPHEIRDLKAQISAIAKLIEENINVENIVNVMLGAKAVSSKTRSRSCSAAADARLVKNLVKRRRLHEVFSETLCPSHDPNTDTVIAVARDEAFCFYYPQNLQYLEELGMKIVFFSPLHDSRLPEEADALLIGGGYPELYLPELSANKPMLGSIRNALEQDMPSIAECGGFMYLHSVIADRDGREYEMVGAIDGKCTYTGHLVNFGYTQITGSNAGAAPEALIGMRGHEFHYYDSTCNGSDLILCKPSSGREYTAMFATPTRLWGWPHLYYQ